jgi:hypothetical protein
MRIYQRTYGTTPSSPAPALRVLVPGRAGSRAAGPLSSQTTEKRRAASPDSVGQAVQVGVARPSLHQEEPRGDERSQEESRGVKRARRRENSGPTATLQPGRQSSCGSAIARRGRQGLVHRTRSKAHYGSLGGTKVHKYVPASCLARGLVQGIWNALHMITTPIPPPFSRFGSC